MSTNYIEKVKRMQSSQLGAYWPMNEEKGTAVYDYSPNGYNGTSSGLVRVPETRGFLAPDGSKCAQFDGTATYIDLISAAPTSATTSQTEGSLSVWVATPEANLSSTSKMQVVALSADTANGIGIHFDATAYRFSGRYFAGAADATYSVTYGPLIYNVDGGVPYQWPEWHHLGMTYSATDDALILYTDGDPSTTAASLGTWTGNYATANMVVGSTSTTIATAYTGWMAHLAWWSNAILTEAEMRELAKIGP